MGHGAGARCCAHAGATPEFLEVTLEGTKNPQAFCNATEVGQMLRLQQSNGRKAAAREKVPRILFLLLGR